MPEFLYTARTADGKLKKDRIFIKNKEELSNYLKSQGYFLTSYSIEKESGKFSINRLLASLNRVPAVEKIFFTQNLSIMVKTGFSLAQALNTLASQTTNKKFSEIIKKIQSDVESGISFSNALIKYPDVFPEIFVNMISAGEASGKLDEILQTLTKQMKKDHALISKVKTAMMYPSVIVIAMFAIGTIMLITVIPKITEIFVETGLDLPLPTKILIGISNLLIHYGIHTAVGLIILLFIFFRVKKSNKGKLLLHKFYLSFPLIGKIIKKINIARLTRTLSSLLKTDIPIVQTLQIISKTLGNVQYRLAVLSASEKVKKGVGISKTFEQFPKLFPPIVVQMINIGEESGSLDNITEQMSDFYEEDVDQTMNGLSTIIEPILMLVIGAVVAVIALAVLMPMYGLVNAI